MNQRFMRFCPLVGALAAGCTAVLKPSPYTPSVSAVCKKMVEEFFPENIVAIIEGNRDVNTLLLKERYDIIFFTGSPKLARIITAAAAPNLTPTILELGGKSPCIVDKEADIKLAAKRIMWGKIINAGQTCIAPDYLFVHAEVKHLLFDEMKKAVDTLLPNIKENNYFPRIVNSKSFKRLSGYLKSGNIIFGGDTDEHERYISPTLIDNVDPESPIMQEEIFGPILPAMSFKDIEEVITFVNSREKPLAFYYFGSTDKGWKVINRTTSGGACLNDVIMHISNSNMPFGGVGNSGMGRYHGKESFLAFSNRRSVLNSVTTIDNPIKYPPFKGVGLLKKIL
ncbi:MAG: aldehyde dehydrogenase family protein [Paludibacteraceae bacterium]|nr:aldehyde dehydrogenase family protein [Paludibacteraceae bacterium]